MEEREALLQRIAELESRLVDTEVFLSTEPGALIQDLEVSSREAIGSSALSSMLAPYCP